MNTRPASTMVKDSLGQRGFTLIELLVALGIFAVLSVMAYGGLRTVMNTRDYVRQQAERLAELQTAFTIIGRDIEQAINRDIRDEFGDRQPAITTSSGGRLIEFTRTGWSNPLPERVRSDLQRVAYRIKEDRLERLNWSVLDRAQDSEPVDRILLNNVTAVEIRFLDESDQWQDQWPPDDINQDKKNNATPMPKAVEITIDAPGWGRVPRLFRVPGAGAVIQQANKS